MSNKRIRRPKKEKESLLEEDDLFGASPVGSTADRAASRKKPVSSREIHAEIERLECIIAAAPQMKLQTKLRQRNILPPADELLERRPRKPAVKPLHAQRMQNRQRLKQLGQLLIIILCIAAMAGWLKQLG
jgi:hypothetical protein